MCMHEGKTIIVELTVFSHICNGCDGLGGGVRIEKEVEAKKRMEVGYRLAWLGFKCGVHLNKRSWFHSIEGYALISKSNYEKRPFHEISNFMWQLSIR